MYLDCWRKFLFCINIIFALKYKRGQGILEIPHIFMIHLILKMVLQVKKLDIYEVFCGYFLCKKSTIQFSFSSNLYYMVESLFIMTLKDVLILFTYACLPMSSKFTNQIGELIWGLFLMNCQSAIWINFNLHWWCCTSKPSRWE